MAVKRKRVLPNHQSDEQIRDGNIRSSITSIGDITQVLFFDILMRLPTKSIIFCKSVCKEWYNLISDPEFAKFHSAQAKPQFFIRESDCTRVSRTLYLFEPNQYSHIFDLDNCRWNQWCNCPIELTPKIKIPSIMKIPLNNADWVLPGDGQDNPEFDAKAEQTCLELKPRDHMFKVANSCHGLLCLSEPLHNDPVAVCNPLTGDYINLPKAKNNHHNGYLDCGLGFSPKSNTYKVIRVHSGISKVDSELKTYGNAFAEVHTLGTVSWRSVVKAPRSTTKLAYPTYHDGALYCLYSEVDASLCIISFNFDDEKFTPVPLPHGCNLTMHNVSLGVLSGDLCLCDASSVFSIETWAMKNNGSGKSWTKLFSIRERRGACSLYNQPINYFENGVSLMFRCCDRKLVYYDQHDVKYRYFFITGLKTRYEVIAYTPSFIPLKNIVEADYVEVLNVNSRCGKLKLPGETQALYLDQNNREWYKWERDEERYWMQHLWMKE